MHPYFAETSYIRSLLKKIADAGLSVPDGFTDSSIEMLRGCYNGVGPAQWSHRFRKIVTWLLDWFEPEALIHDWEFTYAAKNYMAFTKANLRLLFNGVKYALFTYRYISISGVIKQSCKAALLAILCQLFGWQGYKKENI